jgi:hypothetical protein
MDPGIDPQQKQKDRDERNHPGTFLHGPHIPLHLGVPNDRPEADLHPPKSVPPEGVVPPAEFKYSPPKSRGFSSWRGGGFLAGIGAALGALFKGLGRRRKES